MLVSVVACPENAGVECVSHNCRDVSSVDGALCRMANVVPANVGVVERIASGFGVDCKGVGVVLALPLLNERVNGINQAVLGNGVEETDEIVVGGM